MKGSLILEKLDFWVKNAPNKTLFSFLDDSGKIVDSYTYESFDSASRNVAGYLISKLKLSKGERVVLAYPPSLDFIEAFFGCLRAGVIAVPVYPPDPQKGGKDMNAFSNITASCGAKIALTNGSYFFSTKVSTFMDVFTGSKYEWPDLKWVETDQISKKETLKTYPFVDENDVAFLQYTSGSTSDPKGVILTHKNLNHNLEYIVSTIDANSNTVEVSWLPQYHDMGLIGAYLALLYCGGTGYYVSPFTFIKQPTIWPSMLSKYRATHTQAPSFAFNLTARKFNPKNSKLDLSSLKHVINAAEPIDPIGIDQFINVFKPFGIPDKVIKPTYGLAEHTVSVCTNGKNRVTLDPEWLNGGRGTFEETCEQPVQKVNKFNTANDDSKLLTLVGCGSIALASKHGVDIKIVNASEPEKKKELLPDGEVGEIWVRSESCASGYWNMKELSTDTFNVDLCNLGRGFLRTGDLGLIWNDQLYVTGRSKDVIIIRGYNHYPQDIERCVEAIFPDLIRPGCTAAISVENGSHSEQLIIITELRKDQINKSEATELSKKICIRVSDDHGISPGSVIFVKQKTIPKTTSGKISRSRCRKEYIEGTLQIIQNVEDPTGEAERQMSIYSTDTSLDHFDLEGLDSPQSDEEEFLKLVLAQVKVVIGRLPKNKEYDYDTPLLEMGFDSMKGIELLGQLETFFKVQLPDEALMDPKTSLRDLAAAIRRNGKPCDNRYLVFDGKRSVARSGKEDVVSKRCILKGSFHSGLLPSDVLPIEKVFSPTLSEKFSMEIQKLKINKNYRPLLSAYIPMCAIIAGVALIFGATAAAISVVGFSTAFAALLMILFNSDCTKVSDELLKVMMDHFNFNVASPEELTYVGINTGKMQALIIGRNYDRISQFLSIHSLNCLLRFESFGSLSKPVKDAIESGSSVTCDISSISEESLKDILKTAIESGCKIIPVVTFLDDESEKRSLLVGQPLGKVQIDKENDSEMNETLNAVITKCNEKMDKLCIEHGNSFRNTFKPSFGSARSI